MALGSMVGVGILAGWMLAHGGASGLLQPIPYLDDTASPFTLGTGTFCLEDFEGAGFDVPGVTGNGSVIAAGSIPTRSKERTESGEAKCLDGNVKSAGKRLRQAGQKLAQFAHRLRSNRTRRNVPAEVREPLAAEADAIKGDAKALAENPACAT